MPHRFATHSRAWILTAVAVVAIIAVAFRLRQAAESQAIAREVVHARTALQRKDLQRASQLVEAVLLRRPRHSAALLIAAEVDIANQESTAALRRLAQIPKDSAEYTDALYLEGELCVRIGLATQAETALKQYLAFKPDDLDASFILSFVLGAEGRSWETLPYISTILKQRRADLPQLLLVGLPEIYFIDRRDFRDLCLIALPNDPLPLLGEARAALIANDHPRALQLLKKITRDAPQISEAQARLGMLLLQQSADEFLAWERRLPAQADDHPDIWVARGLYAQQTHSERGAVRCFAEALRRHPNHLLATLRMTAELTRLGEQQRAAPFKLRGERLGRLAVPMRVIEARSDLELTQQIVVELEGLGRLWEAAGWSEWALKQQGDLEWAQVTLQRLKPALENDPPLTLAAENPALQINLADWPLPDWKAQSVPPPTSSADRESTVRWVDEAQATGIHFVYERGVPSTQQLRIFEFTGGGIAAVDFDLDYWPDLYLTQGGTIPVTNPAPTDRLFRNSGDGQFVDVTAAARLAETGFGQGCTVGDFNQDGFPDLYIANLGPNRLLQNNGDGTWTDVTMTAAIAGDDWTTSCLMADVNRDSLPDIYAVNYLTAPDLLTRTCDVDGRPRSCSPSVFPAAQDRLYLNQGDGRFADITETAGIRESRGGRGLGIVAGDFRGDGTLGLYVANDTDANFLYLLDSAGPGTTPVFQDEAIVRNVALSSDGLAQASMGIAAGDADGNGLLDLFVTNFSNESNALYLQESGGLFNDAARSSGLYDPSFAMLGFGTQFVDGELDGWPDLIVTNGHVQERLDQTLPYQMPPQYFHNAGEAHFVEIPARSSGPYFERPYLGRVMARLDWNRDGRDDVAIGHLDAPLALLTNRTSPAGHFLALHLRATSSSREAIGTHVTVRTKDRRFVQQLTAGDGYQSSNERRLTVGLGPSREIDKISIRWPGGREQSFSNVAADAEWIAVEGQNNLFSLHVD